MVYTQKQIPIPKDVYKRQTAACTTCSVIAMVPMLIAQSATKGYSCLLYTSPDPVGKTIAKAFPKELQTMDFTIGDHVRGTAGSQGYYLSLIHIFCVNRYLILLQSS